MPVYHVVSDRKLDHITHLYHYKNVDQFEKDLAFFQERFHPIRPEQLWEHVSQGTKLPERPLLLTFDDGIREQHTTIAPMLKEKGFSAVFFVTTGFIDNRELFYRMKASLLLSHFTSTPPMEALADEWSRDAGYRAAAAAVIRETTYENRHRLDDMAAALGISFEKYLRQERPFMSTEEVNRLAREGFLIGGHGVDHARFGELPLNERVEQISVSMAEVVHKFNPFFRAFAFPFNAADLGRKFFEFVNENDLMDISFGMDGLMRGQAVNHFNRFSMDDPGVEAAMAIHRLHIQKLRARLSKEPVRRI